MSTPATLLALCLLLAGCDTTPDHSPLFDQTLLLNGHYELVYPKE